MNIPSYKAEHIAIFSVPRSGSTWLGQIFNSSENVSYRYQPIHSYSFPFSISQSSSKEEIENFYSNLFFSKDPFICQEKNLSGNATPVFTKEIPTHLVWKEVRHIEVIESLLSKTNTKVIGLIRHPCSVINSWINAPKEFDKAWNIEEEWRFASQKNITLHDYFGFEKWISTTNLFLKLKDDYPTNFELVKYEELVTNPIKVIEVLFNFCELEISPQVINFIKRSTSVKSNDPYDVYRKDVNLDQWKENLDSKISNEILNDPKARKPLIKLGYLEN